MHKISKIQAAQIAVNLLCKQYDIINPTLYTCDVPLSLKIEIAKRKAIKQVLNNCQCNGCIDIAFEIHELNLFL